MWRWAGATVVVVGLAAVGAWLLTRSAALPASSGVVRLSIPFLESPRRLPIGNGHLAISDDGLRVAYAAANRLWLRRMDQEQATAIRSGSNPFFSPNGEWVGLSRRQRAGESAGGRWTLGDARRHERPAGRRGLELNRAYRVRHDRGAVRGLGRGRNTAAPGEARSRTRRASLRLASVPAWRPIARVYREIRKRAGASPRC